MEIEWKVFNKSQSIPIGTVSSVLYVLNLFETSGTASCGTTGIDPEQIVEKNREREGYVHCTSRGEVLLQMWELASGPWVFWQCCFDQKQFQSRKEQGGQHTAKKE